MAHQPPPTIAPSANGTRPWDNPQQITCEKPFFSSEALHHFRSLAIFSQQPTYRFWREAKPSQFQHHPPLWSSSKTRKSSRQPNSSRRFLTNTPTCDISDLVATVTSSVHRSPCGTFLKHRCSWTTSKRSSSTSISFAAQSSSPMPIIRVPIRSFLLGVLTQRIVRIRKKGAHSFFFPVTPLSHVYS